MNWGTVAGGCSMKLLALEKQFLVSDGKVPMPLMNNLVNFFFLIVAAQSIACSCIIVCL